MNQLRVPLLASILLPAVIACSGERAGGDWAGTIDTLSDGSVAVHNPETGAIPLDSLWSVEVLARVGTLEGTGPDMFARISDLAVDDYGRVWLTEGQAKEVRVFGEDGRHVRTVGRPGGGPGEFEQPTGISVGPEGHLWIMDARNARISVFDTAGNHLRDHRRESAGYSTPCRCGHADGRYHDFVFTADGPVLLRFTADMRSVDTLALPERPGERARFELVDQGGRRRIAAAVPFTPGTSWTVGGNGTFWYSPQSPYRIYRLSLDHDTLLRIEKEHAPRAVTDVERRRVLERLEWFTRQGGEVDLGRIPEEKPAISDFLVDSLGYLWVIPYPPDTTDETSGTRFDIFDPEGRYLGALQVPVPLERGAIITEDRIFGVTTDELDVQYLVVLRLERDSGVRLTDVRDSS